MKRTENQQVYQITVDNRDYLYNFVSGDVYEFNSTLSEDDLSGLYKKELFSNQQLIQWKAEKSSKLSDGIEFQNLCLVLTQDCNMRCVYCYENGGCFNRERKIMDIQTIKSSIEWWESGLPDNISEVSVSFYGGEPLLNEKGFLFAIKYINSILQKRKVKIKYSITTNGTIISNEILDAFHENNISVMLSIDGNEESQNRNRKIVGNKDSYDIVIKNIRKLIKNQIKISARITLTKDNIGQLVNSVNVLWGENVSVIDCIPVLTEQNTLRIEDREINALEQCYKKIEDLSIEHLYKGDKYYFNNYMRIIFTLFNHTDKYYPMCGYYACKKIYCTPEGEVYNCEKMIGLINEKVGDIGKIQHAVVKERILEHTYMEKCSQCVARRICGGMCYADNLRLGSYMQVLCKLQIMQFEHAFRIYIKMLQYDKNFWNNFFRGE